MIRRAYRSRLGGLWTDRCDAMTQVIEQLKDDKISPEEAGQLLFWIKYGYLVIKNAIPESVIDQLNSDIDEAWRGKYPQLKLDLQGQHLPVSPELRSEKTKILDFHFFSEAARKAVFSEEIVKFMKLIFRESPLLFQSLYLERSTEQLLHQDVAYVVVDPPMEMVGVWIAVEDVQEGSGELFCYEKSHQLKDFLFSKTRRYFNFNQDGNDLHDRYLHYITTEVETQQFLQKKFKILAGDVIILKADIVYGELKQDNLNLTRRTILTHYCPKRTNPYYFSYKPEQAYLLKLGSSIYSSAYYKLK